MPDASAAICWSRYTDDTFTQQRVRTDAEQHLGLLGPVIRGEVGDKIK